MWSTHPARPCYELVGYKVDGSEEIVNDICLTKNGMELVPVFVRVAPYVIGSQLSEADENGNVSVRIVGGVNRSDIWSVGFKYEYTYKNQWGHEKSKAPTEYACDYVYTSLTANGEVKNAEEFYDSEYLFALTIDNIPSAEKVTDLVIKVTAFYIADMNGTKRVLSEQMTLETINPTTAE